MSLFDDKDIPDIELSKQSKIEKIEFNSVLLLPEESTWGADIAVDVFDSDGETPSGITVGIFYLGKRVGSGSTDDWGNAIINIKNLPVPEPRDTPVKFEARIKGQAVRAWTGELKVPKTKQELKREEEQIAKEKRKAEEDRKRKAEEEQKKQEEELRTKAEEDKKRREAEETRRRAIEQRKRELETRIRESGLTNIDNKFYICDHPVTQEEYMKAMMPNQSRFQGRNNPVEMVSWFDAVNYCNKRSRIEGLEPVYNINGNNITWDESKIGYRLPTEAEWEYAARGGSRSKGYTYSGSDNIKKVAWYYKNSGGKTQPVKRKKPNELGLYDMSGNVWEWCWDCINEGVLRLRIHRGGYWAGIAEHCTVSARGGSSPGDGSSDVGFRVALSHVKK